MIGIIDIGMGNLGSIKNMLKKIKYESIVTHDIEQISKASKLILPGVGAFDAGMRNIKERGLQEILNKRVLEEKVKVLGICLGMQLLTTGSEEGNMEGLGWIKAYTKKFKFNGRDIKNKIPHIGWNTVVIKKENNLICNNDSEHRYYFVHSYHVICE